MFDMSLFEFFIRSTCFISALLTALFLFTMFALVYDGKEKQGFISMILAWVFLIYTIFSYIYASSI